MTGFKGGGVVIRWLVLFTSAVSDFDMADRCMSSEGVSPLPQGLLTHWTFIVISEHISKHIINYSEWFIMIMHCRKITINLSSFYCVRMLVCCSRSFIIPVCVTEWCVCVFTGQVGVPGSKQPELHLWIWSLLWRDTVLQLLLWTLVWVTHLFLIHS